MEILVTIKDESKAEKILAMLRKYSFVKAKPLSTGKQKIENDVKEAVEEMNLILKGKKKARPAEDLINEL